MLHLPLLRGGRPYRSLDARPVRDFRTGETVAELSQANPGLIARDLAAMGEARRALQARPVREILEICRRAARLFAEADLPIGCDGETQSPDEYVRRLSATSGLPETLCRFNLEKIRGVLDGMEAVLAGLTRGLDLSVLDSGWGEQDGRRLSYLCQTEALGAILPSNSPGVHNLWLPALALKVPLALKPGREEPWTPFRLCQALIAAGLPPAALGFYPCDHAGATEVLLRCGRSMLFGDEATVRPWVADPRVQIHGPGRSKVLFGEDQVPHWERHLDLLAISIAENGGRSCLNASGVWLPATKPGAGREMAEALARRLAEIEALPLDHPQARLAAFPRPQVARHFSDLIDRHLRIPGAVDLTAEIRGGGRVAEAGGCTFLLPTLIWCEDPEHPLANSEFLFPFAAVVQMPVGSPREELLARIGPTLVATALTEDRRFERELLACPWIDRLNLGPIPTSRISWDQPHEGNLFAHLYRQRSIQAAPGVPIPGSIPGAGELIEARP
jgi:acyl-CoA reductase-like NAD-dependent aldehyde dehydrogenase